MSQKHLEILEKKEQLVSNQKVSNSEQETSVTLQNTKLVNKGNYLLSEIIKSQTIPSGTAGF